MFGSQASLLDEFIIQEEKAKVNGIRLSFTICLHPWKKFAFLFTKRSKNIANMHVDSPRQP